ncbi:MAG: class I SAM-dependent methyltransferase [candidate division Zixibacteria bacterium]|nr:class I SAM-dependent methyltransferase [candidate division Zixibacteria bacterium]
MDVKYSTKGNQNLQTIARSDNFCNWMYSQIRPFLHGNILEIGSGVGSYSQRVIADFPDSQVVLSDIDEGYVETLGAQYAARNNVRAVRLDLANPPRRADFAAIRVPIHSAFALNVMEHIADDVAAFNNIYELLQPAGTYVVLVPAHMFLYNAIDKAIDHYRRYNRRLMRKKIAQTGFRIERMFYFNFLSILGWYVNGNILKKELINEQAMGLFNKFVPLLKVIEKYILRQSVGLSLITVLRKNSRSG